jgi:hypothetical protein
MNNDNIILFSTMFGTFFLFSTGLFCVNLELENPKNKHRIYINGIVMGLSGLFFSTVIYKKSHLFF